MDLARLHLHWRVSRYKGKSYRSYSLARAYREQGKNRKEIVLKLGKLTDAEAQRWRGLLHAIKKPGVLLTSLDDLVVTRHYAYLDVATSNALWDYWQLDEAFPARGNRDIGSETIARILTVNRCIDPATKSQIPHWFRSTALPWLLQVSSESVNPSRIFRELTVIEQYKESICSHLYTKMRQRQPASLDSVFYDLSSTTFTGSRCVLMKWGHCKEGYHNHVVLALVVNREGLPFYWEVLPGGTADATTIIWLIQRLSTRFELEQTTLVFDRGMVSDENLAELEEEGVKYISAMDRSQLEGITGLDFTVFSYLTPEQVDKQADELPHFAKLNESTYYREIPLQGKRRYILCFNPQLFQDQRKARVQAIADFHRFVQELNAELRTAKRSRQRKATKEKFTRRLKKVKLNTFVDVKLRLNHVMKEASQDAVRTYQAVVIVDEQAKREAGKLDGFWLLVTNHTETADPGYQVTAEGAIMPYREKVVIESAFRDIKSFVEVKPVYVWTEEHVKAHYTCCVLSHLINRTLSLRLHENEGVLSKEVVSHERLYEELSDCQFDQIEVQNMQLSTYNMTRVTDIQKELLERTGLTYLLSFDTVKQAIPSLYSA
ncbi:MAG: IS1634 family transposase [Gammaproteobacteria bacterium]|nr:IS1634 family transposase [Gammaproteobacteria bacterium]